MKPATRFTFSNTGLAAALAAGLTLGTVQHAIAAGTTAGTTISNSATLAYSVGGVAQPGITSAAATFLVDEKINVTVVGGLTTNVVPGSTAQATAFTVTNNSNSALDFSLAVNAAIAGDQFDPTGCSVFVESGATAGYQVGADIATFVDELAADGTRTVYVVCSIPGAPVNADAAIVGMIATARGTFNASGYVATATTLGAVIVESGANTASVDIVFADVAGTDDVARDAKHSARNSYVVASAALAVSKTAVLLCDPYNGVTNPKNIPGSITRWTITVSNTGATAATLTTITDTLAAALQFDANLITGLTAATCVTGAPGVPESATGTGFKVTVSVARLLGAGPSATTAYFTSATDGDGVGLAGSIITAVFATILPVDVGSGHATAGLLNAGESVSIVFNTSVL